MLIFDELKVALTSCGILSLQEMIFKNIIFSCAVRGYHFCRNIWNSTKEIFFAASLKAWKKFDMLALSWHDVEGRTVLIWQWKHQEQQNLFYVSKPPFQ